MHKNPVYRNLEDSSSGTRRHTYDEIKLHEPDEDLDDVENQDNGKFIIRCFLALLI